LILFELVFSFKTEMEKQKRFFDLKENSILPEELIAAYPQIANLIISMCEKKQDAHVTLQVQC